ncbi:hypothetical protein E2C01_040673 [Portunus trituberculatus]|uniref:Uncharacterized protein n=1 Tax=Portunus trituberculatus TaxID=210409 RepID=A0A5B7FI13_PORTR|nr:hypothetical protein [Portunus trituberculatus]
MAACHMLLFSPRAEELTLCTCVAQIAKWICKETERWIREHATRLGGRNEGPEKKKKKSRVQRNWRRLGGIREIEQEEGKFEGGEEKCKSSLNIRYTDFQGGEDETDPRQSTGVWAARRGWWPGRGVRFHGRIRNAPATRRFPPTPTPASAAHVPSIAGLAVSLSSVPDVSLNQGC